MTVITRPPKKKKKRSSKHPLSTLKFSQVGCVEIGILPHKLLRKPLKVLLEPDDGGFIARTIDLPLYSYSEDPIEALQNLKYEIESLYDDLQEDDNFSEDWLHYKRFLQHIVID